mgnify:CR=1 FL=1
MRGQNSHRYMRKILWNNTFTVAIDGGAAQEFTMPEGIPNFASGWITVADCHLSM